MSAEGAAKTHFLLWLAVALLCAPAFAALVAFAGWHLWRTGFWYDESMQFWMSLGLDAFGPNGPAGRFRDVINQNAIANLDPGGFTIILWLWLNVATTEVWQRILPFLFFLAAMACFGWLGWTLRRSIPFALLSSLAPAAYPLMLDYATEVRAYSMELAGIAVGCVLVERARSRPDVRPALVAGAVFALFLGSRYSFGLFAAAALVALAFATFTDSSVGKRQSAARLAAFAVPVAVASAVIFLAAFWPQYKIRMTPGNGTFLQYFAATTAQGKPWHQVVAMLASNLLRPYALPLTVAALLGAAVLGPRRWRERSGAHRIRPESATFGVLALAALVLSALVWRWHPWDMTQKWSLWLHALSAVALVHLAAGILAWAAPPHPGGLEADPRVAAVMLVGILVLDLRLATHRREGNTVAPVLAYLELAAPGRGSVAVDIHWYPTVRYFYEYGAFAGSPLYPETFRVPTWTAPKPLVSAQTRYIVTAKTLEEAKSSFQEHRLTRDPALPAHLFRVEPITAEAATTDD